MRIPIREQIYLLAFLCSLLAIAVISIATWVVNNNFVIGVKESSLSLTAALYSLQLLSNLQILQSSVRSTSTRVLIQQALQRYNDDGNNTDQNWNRASADLQDALNTGDAAQFLLQAQLFAVNDTGVAGRDPLLSVSVSNIFQNHISLPYTNPNGSSVLLGQNGTGFPADLYPNLTYAAKTMNGSYRPTYTFYQDIPLHLNSTLLIGPWLINQTFSLLSITVPVTNNTDNTNLLGWLTVLMTGELLHRIQGSVQGLGDTGVLLLVGPARNSNKFAQGTASLHPNTVLSAGDDEQVRFVLPPLRDPSRSSRHASMQNSTGKFPLQSFPAVADVLTRNHTTASNAGSILDSTNESGDRIAAGFALLDSPAADWVVIVEQAYSETVQPLNYLRNVLVACLFGTIGGILLIIFPIAHYFARPIQRLREATQNSVGPYGAYNGDSGPASPSNGESLRSSDEENTNVIARKEGFLGRIRTRYGAHSRTRKREDRRINFRIPAKVKDSKHFVYDELTDLTRTFNEMIEELTVHYERLEERVRERTAELELSKKAAEAANESKTLFIANISHELKTPLNGILGMAAVCMHEEDQSKIKRSLGIIYKSGDLLLHLLTDLLTFSKNQIGQQISLEEKEFRLVDICSQVVSIFEKQAKDGSVDLQVLFQGSAQEVGVGRLSRAGSELGPPGTGRVRDMYLWGDQHRILQVIINLVSNSLKFTPVGGSVTVRIRCTGEAAVDKTPSSQKGSASSRLGRKKHRESESSQLGTPTISPGDASPVTSPSTTPGTNPVDRKLQPRAQARERSPSPASNARTLLFEFEVEDTGPGIPPEQQAKVFEPFVQGDLGLNRKYGGTGLGLSICSQLAKLMKGTIDLKSKVGTGSTFTMRIPLKYVKERADSMDSGMDPSRRSSALLNQSASESRVVSSATNDESSDSDSPGKAAPKVTTASSKPRLVGLSQPYFAPDPAAQARIEEIERVAVEASRNGDKMRVLVAEDNKVNQEVVLRMLKLEDIYDVTLAKDGQEALDRVKEAMTQNKHFDLIFMDIQMPNLDGLQSTRLIRKMGYSAPIVALTAFAEESNMQDCIDSGMDYFLPKPIRRPALKQVLKRYCATIHEEAADETDDASAATTKNERAARTSPAAKNGGSRRTDSPNRHDQGPPPPPSPPSLPSPLSPSSSSSPSMD